jgi:hypothetical protein
MGALLLAIAVLLLYVLFLPLVIIGFDIILFEKGPVEADNYLRKVAEEVDRLGNVFGAPVWNKIFIKNWATIKFGSRFDTMSYVLGMAKKEGSLTWLGSLLSDFLNLLDKNHVEKAILVVHLLVLIILIF